MAEDQPAEIQEPGPVVCPVCSAEFKTAQGLAGHRRFRHGDAEKDAQANRSQRQRMEILEGYETDSLIPPATAVLIARLKRRYGDRRGRKGDTNCLICGAVTRTPQGLAGHMRHRHSAGSSSTAGKDLGKAADLLRYLHATELPEPIAEAVWEKIFRFSGFRW